MGWYPSATRRQISRNFSTAKTKKNCVILHTTASGTATSQFGWFNTAGANASSHFHISNSGTVEQYINTDQMSYANRDGNRRSVTVETQGTGNEAWTTAQVRALVALVTWICRTHDIPVRQMTSSKSSQRGIGWHRLGVNGNFPTSGILRGRNQRGGGELWSGAAGKSCPGTRRIQQIPGIIKQITKPPPGGSTMSARDMWRHRGYDYINDNASTKDHQLARAHEYSLNQPSRVWGFRGIDYVNDDPATKNLQIARAHQYSYEAPGKVLFDRSYDYVSESPSTLRHQVARAHQYSMDARREAREANAKLDALADALADTLSAVVNESVKDAFTKKLGDIKDEIARVNAEDVAAELEVAVKETEEDES